MNPHEIMRLIDEEVANRPEAFIDVLEGLEEAALNTASHALEHWQDENTATVWESVADQVRTLNYRLKKKLRGIGVGYRVEP